MRELNEAELLREFESFLASRFAVPQLDTREFDDELARLETLARAGFVQPWELEERRARLLVSR